MRSRCGSCTMRPDFIAHRSQIAHFSNGEQALILGIVLRDTVQEIDIFDRRAGVRS